MDWNAVSAIAGAVGALGTIIALVFVYWQLRNIVKSQSAAAVQSIVNGERELWQIVLSDEKMTGVVAHHLGLDSELLDRLGITARVALQMLLFFRQYENLFYQHRHGMVPAHVWDYWKKSMKYTFGDQVCADLFLHQAKRSYTKEFRDFVDEFAAPRAILVTESRN